LREPPPLRQIETFSVHRCIFDIEEGRFEWYGSSVLLEALPMNGGLLKSKLSRPVVILAVLAVSCEANRVVDEESDVAVTETPIPIDAPPSDKVAARTPTENTPPELEVEPGETVLTDAESESFPTLPDSDQSPTAAVTIENVRYDRFGTARVPTLGGVCLSLRGLSTTDIEQLSFHLEIGGDGAVPPFRWNAADLIAVSASESAPDAAEIVLPLFGLKALTDYSAVFEVRERGRSVARSQTIHFSTPDVPNPFPRIRVTKSDPSRMEPGLTVFDLIHWKEQKSDTSFGAIVALDADGNVRWCYLADHLIFVVRQLANGHLLYGYGNRADGLMEIDLSGNIVRQWAAAERNRQVPGGAIPVAVDSFHHDVIPVDGDRLISLSTVLQTESNYFDPSYHSKRHVPLAHLVGDEIVEMTTNGSIVRRLSLFDLLDPRRIGYGSLDGFWNVRGYEIVDGGTFDWSHANSVTLDPRDDSLIISVRHQDAVIKVDRRSGELKWILGNSKGWNPRLKRKWLRPVSPFEWFYHQHAVELTPQGTLLMFDNGNYRATPFDPPLDADRNRSRVVEFRVNEQEMTVSQVWDYDGGADAFYSTFFCDVDWLQKTKNVLITNGGEIRDVAGRQTDVTPGVQQWAEIFEVTYGPAPEKVFEVIIDSDPELFDEGWSVYRAERTDRFFETSESGTGIR
jgi:arylsulfate sulfotransferase